MHITCLVGSSHHILIMFYYDDGIAQVAQFLQAVDGVEGKYNISEIAYMTGFNTLSHFSTSFKKQFGCTPSEYSKKTY